MASPQSGSAFLMEHRSDAIKRQLSSVKLVDHHQEIPSPHKRSCANPASGRLGFCRAKSPGVTARST